MDRGAIVLVPLDGSRLAEQTLVHVPPLATALDARVRLLHITTRVDIERMIVERLVPSTTGSGQRMSWHEKEAQAEVMLRQQVERYLQEQAERLRAVGLRVDTEVRSGSVVGEIVEAADSEPNTLVAMATHGYGGLRRLALGSVADTVLRATAAPLFLVPPAEQSPAEARPWQRILVPLDDSELARAALPIAVALAAGTGAELVLMRAVEATSAGDSLAIVLRSQAEQELVKIAQTLGEGCATTTAVTVGSPSAAIVEAASERDADVIVMASHGHGGLRRWMVGSVADRVVQSTPIPILLVHPRSG